MTGNSVSLTKVRVCVWVPTFPQASVTDHVLVTVTWQPFTTSAPSVNVGVSPDEQLSVTEAAPKAAAIWAVVGLHDSVPGAPTVITGLTLSTLLNVLLQVLEQPLLLVMESESV
jgi:hypothetical protein